MLVHEVSQLFKVLHVQTYKTIVLVNVSMISLVFFEVFLESIMGLGGSIFGHIFGSSKNVPKNIAICPGVKINHVGIIFKPPKIQMH